MRTILATTRQASPLKSIVSTGSFSKVDDVTVLREIADGDADALALWFRRHKDAVYAFVFYRMGNDPDLAADATQATFMTALERLDDFDSERGDMIT